MRLYRQRGSPHDGERQIVVTSCTTTVDKTWFGSQFCLGNERLLAETSKPDGLSLFFG
jgi:hypothetical protein